MAILRHRSFELRLEHPFRLSRGTSETRENLLIEIEVGGLIGRGEAAPIPRYRQDRRSAAAALDAMAAHLEASGGDLGVQLRAFDEVGSRAAEATGTMAETAARAALDMALRDLAGQRLGAPVYELLGLDATEVPPTSFTLGMDSPAVMVDKLRQAPDFDAYKIKLGSPDDRAMLEAIRDTTDRPLRVDANEGWSFDDALERLDWLAALGVELVEQPLPAEQIAETAELRRLSPLPFFADESVHTASDIPRLARAFDGINIKLMKSGGLGEALRMIHVARAHDMKIMLGCMVESSLAITAATHLSPLVDLVDLDGHLLVTNDPFTGAVLHQGRLHPPDRPGLGVEIRT